MSGVQAFCAEYTGDDKKVYKSLKQGLVVKIFEATFTYTSTNKKFTFCLLIRKSCRRWRPRILDIIFHSHPCSVWQTRSNNLELGV